MVTDSMINSMIIGMIITGESIDQLPRIIAGINGHKHFEFKKTQKVRNGLILKK